MKRLAWTAGLAGLALAILPTAPAQAMDLKEFKKKFGNTPNSWERRELVTQLDPTDKKALKILFVVLEDPNFDWYMREGAIDVLAGVYDPATIKKLEKIKPNRDPLLAEAIAIAFGRSKNKERIPYILDCLESKKWVVRRAAAVALRYVPAKESVEPLIDVWWNEKKFGVWIHILETLETITRQRDLGDDPQKWLEWWEANKDTFEVGDKTNELSDDEKAGDVIKTRVRGANLTVRSRGRGLPLLVLPAYGYDKSYLETYLRNLEDTNQILYMKLPGVADLCASDSCTEQGCSHGKLPNVPGTNYPEYPLDRIGKAFEALQQALVKGNKIKGKFAVMAHGDLSAWLAMRFSEKYPRAVRRLILIGATSGDKATSEGIQRLVRTGQRIGDVEMEHYGLNRQIESGKGAKYKPSGPEDEKAIDRKKFTVRFGDKRNLEIGRLYGPVGGVPERNGAPKYARYPGMGSLIIPKFSLFKLSRRGTPTLVMAGDGSIESNLQDGQAIARHYGKNAQVVRFRKSGDMPFIEENDKFVEILRKWLGGKKKRKKRRKKRKKKKKKKKRR